MTLLLDDENICLTECLTGGEVMFENALYIELIIGVLIFFAYKLVSSVNSKKAQENQLMNKQKQEQEKEIKRAAILKENIKKNTNKFQEIANISIVKNNVNGFIPLINDINKEFKYDYESKELGLEEQKAYYEERIVKLKALQLETESYISILPFIIHKLYNWGRFASDYSIYLIDIFKNKGFDIISTAQRLYNETIIFQKELKKTIKNMEKKYDILCKTVEGRKKIKKELKKFKGEVLRLTGVRYNIKETLVTFDYIIVTENGIFCLIIKHLDIDASSGEIIDISEDEKWVGERFDGSKFDIDPIDGQVYKDITLFQKWINDTMKEKHKESIPYYIINPLIIIINENIEIRNHSEMPILKLSNVFNHVQLFKGKKIEVGYLENLKEILETNNIEHNKDIIDDNCKLLENNATMIQNVFKVFDLMHRCAVDYCLSVEKENIIKAYRQYLAFEHLLKYKSSVKDAKMIRVLSTPMDTEKEENYIVKQDPLGPLLDRLIEPCFTTPIKILAKMIDISMAQLEYVIKDIYNIQDIKTVPAISYQYINRAMMEIISVNTSEKNLNQFMNTESLGNITLYKFSNFEPS